jgi:hypothetical protein
MCPTFRMLRPTFLRLLPVASLCLAACAPRLQHYNVRVPPSAVLHDEPLVLKTLGVATLVDNRPAGERADMGGAIADTIMTVGTFGVHAMVLADGEARQPLSNLDNDVADYLVKYIRKTGIFQDVVRVSGRSEVYNKANGAKTIAEADLLLVGEIKRFWGHWETGALVNRQVRVDGGLKEKTSAYELAEAYGIVDLVLRIINTSDGAVLWSKAFKVRKPHNGDIHLDIVHNATIVRNELGAEALGTTIAEVLNDLELHFSRNGGSTVRP